MNRGAKSYAYRELKRYREELETAAYEVAYAFEYGNPPSEGQKRRLISAVAKYGVARNFADIIRGKGEQ